MKPSSILNSSEAEDWPTNIEWFLEWNAEFGFTLDAASSHVNAKCRKHFTIEENGLQQTWANERVFINPPYNDLYSWVKKAHVEMINNHVFSVLFIPVRTANNYWHDFVWDSKKHCFRPGVQVRFLRRMKFADSPGPCPFGLMLLIFNPKLLNTH